jgi:2,4-dichlorophenol 6-monooxygenase
LITDSEGSDWTIAANNIRQNRGIEIFVAQIGDNCSYRDYDDRWDSLKGTQSGGAILVRPDNIVAWRSVHKSRGGGIELEIAMAQLLQGDIHVSIGEDTEEYSKAKL